MGSVDFPVWGRIRELEAGPTLLDRQIKRSRSLMVRMSGFHPDDESSILSGSAKST